MDFETQRRNMVELQVRPSDVTDRRIIRAMLAIPRESFVPGPMRALAYMDAHVAVAGGPRPRALLAPRTFAKLVQLADIGEDAAVLDVGAASGYSSAVLARLARSVVALEADETLAREARESLARLAPDVVTVVQGDLAAGYPAGGPYDAIVVEGAVSEVPAALLEQLKDRGRLVAIARRGALGRAAIWRRLDGTYDETLDFDADAPLLAGFEVAPAFAF